MFSHSARGRALRERSSPASAQVTGPILATIDRADLDTTIRTLEEITRRARATTPRRETDDHAEPARHRRRAGAGDADLTIMLAAHDAFRRDLTRLVRAAAAADLSDPARRQSVGAGWELFKHELHLHHTAEDEVIWPVLRPRLAHSEHALSVLDEMEEEHERIDPLLAAVDAGFARRGKDSLADVIDALVSTLTWGAPRARRARRPAADLAVALTAAEWRWRSCFKNRTPSGTACPEGGGAAEMFRLRMLDVRPKKTATPPPPCARCPRRCACSTRPSGSPASNKTPRW